MKVVLAVEIILSFLMLSCNGKVNQKHKQRINNKNEAKIYSIYRRSDSALLSKQYMPTGFYFLGEGSKGVKMRKEQSDEVYTISPTPFVSVRNISEVNLIRKQRQYGTYKAIYMTIDAEGTNNLKEGTGNVLHPYFALVIANRLLYVIENLAKIETGKMEVIVIDYSDTQIEEMLKAIEQKM